MASKEELQAIRDSIPVDTVVVDETLATEKTVAPVEDEKANQLTEQVEEKETPVDENEEQVDETDEQEEKEVPKKNGISQQTFERRVGKLTAKQRELERQLAERDAELATLKSSSENRDLTPQEKQRQIDLLAEQKAAQMSFDNACNNLADAAEREKPGFVKRLNELANEVAPLPKPLIESILNLDNGHTLLNHFTENPDDYERIYKLSPIRQIQETTKLAESLKRKNAKPISKVPAPVNSITGGAKAIVHAQPLDNDSDDEWYVKREKTRRAPRYL